VCVWCACGKESECSAHSLICPWMYVFMYTIIEISVLQLATVIFQTDEEVLCEGEGPVLARPVFTILYACTCSQPSWYPLPWWWEQPLWPPSHSVAVHAGSLPPSDASHSRPAPAWMPTWGKTDKRAVKLNRAKLIIHHILISWLL